RQRKDGATIHAGQSCGGIPATARESKRNVRPARRGQPLDEKAARTAPYDNEPPVGLLEKRVTRVTDSGGDLAVVRGAEARVQDTTGQRPRQLHVKTCCGCSRPRHTRSDTAPAQCETLRRQPRSSRRTGSPPNEPGRRPR